MLEESYNYHYPGAITITTGMADNNPEGRSNKDCEGTILTEDQGELATTGRACALSASAIYRRTRHLAIPTGWTRSSLRSKVLEEVFFRE